MKQYYMVYATANDAPLLKDYIGLFLTRKYNPGVSPIAFVVVVGCVKKFSWLHRIILRTIITMMESSRHLRCKAVILKSNAGWDFGSVYQGLQIVGKQAQPDDYIIVRNRSTWGPHANGWFKKYIDLAESDASIALTGSTIGLNDHPSRKRVANVLHIQSYVYASQWKYLSSLFPDYPGKNAANHKEAVLQGEIELSQRIMEKGLSIAALQYPDLHINSQNQNEITPEDLNHATSSLDVPISKDNQERSRKYYFKILLILMTMIWYIVPRRRSCKWITLDQ